MAGKESLKASIRTFGQQVEVGLEHHVDLETLEAYFEDRLSPELEEGLRDHLAFCRRCADLALVHRKLQLSQPAEAEAVDDLPSAEGRESTELNGQLAPAALASRQAAVSRSPRFLHLIAAFLCFAVVGLGGWNYKLQEGLFKPDTETVVRQIFPESDQLRGQSETLRVHLEKTPLLLVLEPPEGAAQQYRITMRDFDRQVLWQGFAELGTEAEITVRFPRGLDVGTYRFELFDVEAPQAQPLAEYVLNIDP